MRKPATLVSEKIHPRLWRRFYAEKSRALDVVNDRRPLFDGPRKRFPRCPIPDSWRVGCKKMRAGSFGPHICGFGY